MLNKSVELADLRVGQCASFENGDVGERVTERVCVDVE